MEKGRRTLAFVLGFMSCASVVKVFDELNSPKYSTTSMATSSHDETVLRGVKKDRLIVFPIFPLITDSRYNKSKFNYPDKLEERMLDYVESLQKTLNHDFVEKVHLLFDQVNVPTYVTSRIGHSEKLNFIKVEDAYNVSRVLEYVHKHYIDQLVMITNGDIYPGKGFTHIDYDVMKGKHLFYSPSRHGGQEKRCRMRPDICDPKGKYEGSHDTYIFIPTEPFPRTALNLLKNNHWDNLGTENAIMYAYRNMLGYKLLNPCKLIFVYHNHCSQVRHSNRTRVIVRHLIVKPSRYLQ